MAIASCFWSWFNYVQKDFHHSTMVEAVEKSGLVEISMFVVETGTAILKLSMYHQESGTIKPSRSRS